MYSTSIVDTSNPRITCVLSVRDHTSNVKKESYRNSFHITFKKVTYDTYVCFGLFYCIVICTYWKSSWIIVYIQASQCRTPFILTIFSQIHNQNSNSITQIHNEIFELCICEKKKSSKWCSLNVILGNFRLFWNSSSSLNGFSVAWIPCTYDVCVDFVCQIMCFSWVCKNWKLHLISY